MRPPFLQRIVLRNYKSIGLCDVRPRALTFLVGANGSGKSNFLDGINFVADALSTNLDSALRQRGGLGEVRRRSGGHPTIFSVRLDFVLPDESSGSYGFKIVAAGTRGGFAVRQEECVVRGENSPSSHGAAYSVIDGQVLRTTAKVSPSLAKDRLHLVLLSGLPEFRPLYEALTGMKFYNLNPNVVRELQPPDPGEWLNRDGDNLASVFARLSDPVRHRVREYLSRIVPGVHDVETKAIAGKETLEFKQSVKGSIHPWRFLAQNMSDGTLRAFGILVGLFQQIEDATRLVPLVGLEEPESALHPAAAGVLLDALREASVDRQILVTSHSPDLLDDSQIDTDALLAVESEEGNTLIAPIDEPGRQTLYERLFTPGELLRLNQLAPDRSSLPPDDGRQLDLFGFSDVDGL